MTILTLFSLSRPQEKAHENSGVPLRALGWSLGLHALVLGTLLTLPPREFAGIAPATPLHALLQPAGAGVAPVVAPAVAPVVAPAVAPNVAQPRPAAPAMSRLRVATAAKPVATMPGAVSPELTFASGEEAAAVPAAPGGVPVERPPLAPATLALPAPAPEPGPDAAGLRQYRLSLASEARRYRNYPDAARRNGIGGTVEVRVSVSGGGLHQTELVRTSGHAVLDAAALEMLRAAAGAARVPDSLRGQAFAVLLPVVFNVEE